MAETEKNILGNHMHRLWEIVKDLREKKGQPNAVFDDEEIAVSGAVNAKDHMKAPGGRVDFILDNAGFELYCDCVYGTLCISCLFVLLKLSIL